MVSHVIMMALLCTHVCGMVFLDLDLSCCVYAHAGFCVAKKAQVLETSVKAPKYFVILDFFFFFLITGNSHIF